MSIRKYSKGEVLHDVEAVDRPSGVDDQARIQRLAAADAEDRAADTTDR